MCVQNKTQLGSRRQTKDDESFKNAGEDYSVSHICMLWMEERVPFAALMGNECRISTNFNVSEQNVCNRTCYTMSVTEIVTEAFFNKHLARIIQKGKKHCTDVLIKYDYLTYCWELWICNHSCPSSVTNVTCQKKRKKNPCNMFINAHLQNTINI